MKRSLSMPVIFLFVLTVASCNKVKSKDSGQNVFQSVEMNDTVWVRSSGTQLVMDGSIKMIDISDYSITGKICADTIYLRGGSNNEKPGVAKLFVLLENDSVRNFTVALSPERGSIYAGLKLGAPKKD